MGPLPNRRRLRSLLLAAGTALLAAVLPLPAEAAETAAGIRLSGFPAEELPALRTFVDDVVDTIARIAPAVRLPEDLEFTANAAIARNKRHGHYLPTNAGQRRQRVIAVIWYYHFLPHTGQISVETIPKWLVAATDWLADQPLDVKPVAGLRFPYASYYLGRNQIPHLLHLTNNPVAPDELPVYPLYAESSAVALICLTRYDTAPLRDFLRLYDDRRPNAENLKHLIPAFFHDEVRRHRWYNRQVAKLVAGAEATLSLDESDKLREEYETVAAAPAGVLETAARRIPLDQIRMHMPKWRMTKRVTSELQGRFLDLRQRSHPLLKPVIQRYVDLIPRFQLRDHTTAAREMNEIRQAFKDALLRARQYEARLDALEAATTAGQSDYRSPLPLVESSKPPAGPATRRIENALDNFDR